jgi:acyl-CoA thioesterase-2
LINNGIGPHGSHEPMSEDVELDTRIAASLDDLLQALRMDEAGPDRYVVPTESARLFDRIYGGQLLAQAIVGAGATVVGKPVQSLHATFVKAGTPGRAIELEVTRVRDGRSVAARQVDLRQDDETLLLALVSFHDGGDEPDLAPPPPEVAAPEDTPLLQEWATGEGGRHWIEHPPPLELRIGEPLTFLGGTGTSPTRSHWMRAPRSLGEDPLLHAALLAYGSDFFLMDMVFRAHPADMGPGRANGFSVDHAIWFHRPVRFDEWHLHTQEAVAITGDRGLARGAIHDHGGRLVATVMQEVLVRPLPAR